MTSVLESAVQTQSVALKSGRQVVRDLEDKALENAKNEYDRFPDEGMPFYDLVDNVLPGHSRIARRLVERLISNGNLEMDPNDPTWVRKVSR